MRVFAERTGEQRSEYEIGSKIDLHALVLIVRIQKVRRFTVR